MCECVGGQSYIVCVYAVISYTECECEIYIGIYVYRDPGAICICALRVKIISCLCVCERKTLNLKVNYVTDTSQSDTKRNIYTLYYAIRYRISLVWFLAISYRLSCGYRRCIALGNSLWLLVRYNVWMARMCD